MLKVSIITVVYNAVKTLEKTINSVLEQDYKNIEYLIIDGGSTDGTLNIIEKYRDKIAFFVSEQDKGIYDAMNKGIINATGDIIGMINADDWYEKDVIGKIVSKFENSSADVIFGDVNEISATGEKRRTSFNGYDEIWHSMIPHPATFVKTAIYKQFGLYNLNYKIASDYDFVLRTYSQGVKYLNIDLLVSNYTLGGASMKYILLWAEETNLIATKYLAKATNKNKVINICKSRGNFAYDSYLKDITTKTSRELITKYGRFIVIFGCGSIGKKLFSFIKNYGLEILYFIDSNKEKQGKYFCDMPVFSPNALTTWDGTVFIASKNYELEILNKIKEYNPNCKPVSFFELTKEIGV